MAVYRNCSRAVARTVTDGGACVPRDAAIDARCAGACRSWSGSLRAMCGVTAIWCCSRDHNLCDATGGRQA